MENGNHSYSVKELSKLAGVSVRTLHHYDEIGLLSPAYRSEKGYRFYERPELFRLQQIMFYKTLGYELAEIKNILDDNGFDLVKSLRFQRKQLMKKQANLEELIATIEKTIHEIKSQEGMITDKEMYEGFSKEEANQMRMEATERWGDEVSQVEQRIKEMGKKEWSETKQEAEEINLWLSNLIHKPVTDIEVQKVIMMHFEHISKFYDVSEVRYRGLADMYVADERFKAHYDKVKPGLAEFLNKGMHQFCDNGMKVIG